MSGIHKRKRDDGEVKGNYEEIQESDKEMKVFVEKPKSSEVFSFSNFGQNEFYSGSFCQILARLHRERTREIDDKEKQLRNCYRCGENTLYTIPLEWFDGSKVRVCQKCITFDELQERAK